MPLCVDHSTGKYVNTVTILNACEYNVPLEIIFYARFIKIKSAINHISSISQYLGIISYQYTTIGILLVIVRNTYASFWDGQSPGSAAILDDNNNIIISFCPVNVFLGDFLILHYIVYTFALNYKNRREVKNRIFYYSLNGNSEFISSFRQFSLRIFAYLFFYRKKKKKRRFFFFFHH